MLIEKCPDQLNLPFVLWSRASIHDLLRTKYGKELSISTIGRYLHSWGLSPPKPIFKASVKKSLVVETWLKNDYLAIKERAKKETAEIFWCNMMSMRSNYLAGTARSLKSETPDVIDNLMRFHLNMISSLTNRGELQFMLYKEEITTRVFIDFMTRLVGGNRRKVILIIKFDSIYIGKPIREWIKQHSDRIELIIYFGH